MKRERYELVGLGIQLSVVVFGLVYYFFIYR
ncbi:hypothetical protein A5880_001674 [Enterococcus sp. 4G2_DIV0659]|uniref:Uncharacterized protein n=1 Tax=Candidatus Enterococcus mansonii TaxID=1834181 RepID=A0A242CEA6_9ENTE|nr:hypothetical protein A5880_001594 [Enterococcus sp. 4G2_DIV0659]